MPTETDFHILNTVMARLWKPVPFAMPELALEVIDGEWKGIVFSFKDFEVMTHQLPDEFAGFKATKYNTQIHQLPDTLPKDWTPTAEFDRYTSEVLFKWLSYINQNDMAPLIRARTKGIQ